MLSSFKQYISSNQNFESLIGSEKDWALHGKNREGDSIGMGSERTVYVKIVAISRECFKCERPETIVIISHFVRENLCLNIIISL